MHKKFILIFLVSPLFLIGFITTLVLVSRNQPFPIVNTAVQQAKKTVSNTASPSAISSTASGQLLTPSPTPTPIPIPAQSGKQVRVPILLYHYIGKNPNPADTARNTLSVDPEEFDKQLGYLAAHGYSPTSLDTLYASLKGQAGLPGNPIILSFDDGYMDFYYNAYPILKKYNFHATQFIPTGLMNQSYYLTWAQIKEMDSSGLISFQAHSVNHINLAALSSDKLIYQLTESKNVLQSQLGKPVNFMAYPYGISNQTVWQAVKKAGYLGATGTWYGTTTSEGTIFDMPRIKIPGGITVENFAKRF